MVWVADTTKMSAWTNLDGSAHNDGSGSRHSHVVHGSQVEYGGTIIDYPASSKMEN